MRKAVGQAALIDKGAVAEYKQEDFCIRVYTCRKDKVNT